MFRSEGKLQCIVLVMKIRTDGGSRCTPTAALRIVGDVNRPTTFRFEVSSQSDLRVSRGFKVLFFLWKFRGEKAGGSHDAFLLIIMKGSADTHKGSWIAEPPSVSAVTRQILERGEPLRLRTPNCSELLM